jgi:2',3'-cyclic-nucleotide 2'-phosphodiesterase (5'-nucleotidase family)
MTSLRKYLVLGGLLLSANFHGFSPCAKTLTIFHTNDMHARVTPSKMAVPRTNSTGAFEKIGGAAYLASEMLQLKSSNPQALILDAGDISEGNPLGDLRGNGGMVDFLNLLDAKLKALGGRGIDATVVGNHDYRDTTYLNNIRRLTFPVLSINTCYKNTMTQMFKPYIIDTINGLKIGIIGYTKVESTIGLPSDNFVSIVKCVWADNDPTTFNLRDTVAALRNTYHCDLVVLISHETQSQLFSGATDAVIRDDATVKPPEVVISGHWHTWTPTVWRPAFLHGKTIVAEAASYMEYIGEVNVDSTGKYLGAQKHAILCDSIAPDSSVQTLISSLTAEYNAGMPPHNLFDTIGYSATDLNIDQKSRWWSIDEYPWYGDGTAGEWVSDAVARQAMQNGFPCDLSIQTGGGIRKDIPKGPITYMDLYEVYPWQDNIVELTMTGKQIRDYLQAQSLDAAISSGWQVFATDGIIDSIKYNGAALDTGHSYNVAIADFMYDNYTGGAWPGVFVARTSLSIVSGIIDYTSQFTKANQMTVSGPRYFTNNRLGGQFDAVVTMMDDSESAPQFEAGFLRLLHATDETMAHRGKETPTSLVNADGSINRSHQMCESMWYRSGYGFTPHQFAPGTIVRLRFKGGFYLGTPELCEEEGIYKPDSDFQIIGFDSTLARPASMPDVNSFWNEAMVNHLVRFYAVKTGASAVRDGKGQVITVYQPGGYTAMILPGNVGDMLELTGVQTNKSGSRLFRCGVARPTTGGYPIGWPPSSSIAPIAPFEQTDSTVTLHAAAFDPQSNLQSLVLNPVADAYTVQGKPTSNYGTLTGLYLEQTGTTYLEERPYLKFSLSALPSNAVINNSRLNLYGWKATPTITTACYSVIKNSWTESGITWNKQDTMAPLGVLLDTLTPGGISWYAWNVTSFIGNKHSGDSASFAVLATSGSGSYTFDSKEYSTAGMRPYLQIDYSAGPDNSGVTKVDFMYRYSPDNSTWSAWTLAGTVTTLPYDLPFKFTQGKGYYQFYSIATDKDGNVEPAPFDPDASCRYAGKLLAPVALILANGHADSVTVSGNAELNLSVSLAANDWAGKNAEYWVYINSPVNSPYNGQRFYYGFQNNQWGWTGTAAPAVVQPLSDTPTQSVLTTSDLPSGAYKAYFGVDTLVNGSFDKAGALDSVGFIISKDCKTSIAINGSSSDVTLAVNSPMNVTVGVQSNNWLNSACDYFVYCDTPWGQRYYFNALTQQWQTGSAIASYQGNAADTSNYTVLNMNVLYTGTYTFYFTMDNNQNGVMDGTQATASVRAVVQ